MICRGNSPIPIPISEMALGTQPWLNLDFVEGILRKSEGDNSIQVIDIFSKPATNKGDNYTSDMMRVQVEFSRKQGERKVTEKKSIIVKLAPQMEGMRQDLIAKSGIFDTEMNMLTNTLKKMGAILGPEYRLNARGLHVQKDPTFLVIEDLAPLGFRMADRQAGLDLQHCLLALRALARFHASTVALCEKEPKQKQMYAKGIFSAELPPEMGGFFNSGAKTLAKEVEQWPELGKRYADKIMKLSDTMYEMGIKNAQRRDNEFNVINHGDFWVNNMMFRYDDDGKPTAQIFVDFQLATYTSPAIDLLYFLSTSPSDSVLKESRHMLIEEYLSTLTDTMKQIGCKTKPPTMEELAKTMKERQALTMIAAFTVLPLVRIDKGEVKDLDEIMQKDGTYDNPAYKGQIYRETIVKRIPEYEKMGLLD